MAKRSKRSAKRSTKRSASARKKRGAPVSHAPSKASELASRASSAAVAVGHATLDAMEMIVSVARGAAVAVYEAATPERRERAKRGAVRAAELAGQGAGIVYRGAKAGVQKAHAFISARLQPSAAEVPMLEAVNAASPKARLLPKHHYLARKQRPVAPAPAVVMVPARVSQSDIDTGAIRIKLS